MDLGTVSVTRHDISTAPDGSVWCSCSFRAGAEVWGPDGARRIAAAHLAAPERPTETLLCWVSGRPTTEQAEHDGLLRRVAKILAVARPAADRLAELAGERTSGTIQLAMALRHLAEEVSL